jgi:DNA-binding transcriptional regulator YiaG
VTARICAGLCLLTASSWKTATFHHHRLVVSPASSKEIDMALVGDRLTSGWTPIQITLKPALDQLEHDFGLTSNELAQTLGVDRRTLERWASGDTFPRHAAKERLLALVALHERLSGLFERVAWHRLTP